MTFEKKHRRALELIQKNIKEEENKNKPLLPHLLRVGKYLYDNRYSETIVNAGLLHDVLEWTNNPKEVIVNIFGQEVFDIVILFLQIQRIEALQMYTKGDRTMWIVVLPLGKMLL